MKISKLLTIITNDISTNRICPIHGMPMTLWIQNKYKKTTAKLIRNIATNKGRYFFLAYMAVLSEGDEDTMEVRSKAYKAVKRVNQLYPLGIGQRKILV